MSEDVNTPIYNQLLSEKMLGNIVKKIVMLISAIVFSIGAAFITSPSAHATGAATEICNNASNLLVCMNRQGGGTSDGTHVIGWHPNDPNNDFEWLKENDRCGGAVTATCPFLDPTLNQLYFGYVIVRAYEYGNNKCLVSGNTDSQGYIRGVLSGCNDFGHAFVLPGCLATDFTTCGDNQFHNVPSVDETNMIGGDLGPARCFAWAVTAIGNQVYLSDDCASDPQDAVQQAFF